MSDRELSQKQIEANRANALKSTGPRSDEGKQRSSRNATRHGFFARDLILPGEDPQEFTELKLSMLKRLNPRDVLELTILDQIVSDVWKWRRVRKAERDLFIKAEEGSRTPGQSNPTDPGILLAKMLCDDEDDQKLDRLHRYERRLENSVFRGLRELRRLQGEECIDAPGEFAIAAMEEHEREDATEQRAMEECENEAKPSVAPASDAVTESPETQANTRFDRNEPIASMDPCEDAVFGASSRDFDRDTGVPPVR